MHFRIVIVIFLYTVKVASSAPTSDRLTAVSIAVESGCSVISVLTKDNDAIIVNVLPPKTVKKLHVELENYAKTVSSSTPNSEILENFEAIVTKHLEEAHKIILEQLNKLLIDNDKSKETLSKAIKIALNSLKILAKQTVELKLDYPDIEFEPISTLTLKQMYELIKTCNEFVASHDPVDRTTQLAQKSSSFLSQFIKNYDEISTVLGDPIVQRIKSKSA